MARTLCPLPSPQKQNVKLKAESTPWRVAGVVVALAVIWTAVAGVVFFAMGEDLWSLMGIIFLVLFSLVDAVLIVAACVTVVRAYLLSLAFGRPTLMVSVHPLRLGESFRAAVGQVVKRSQPIKRVHLTLTMEEQIIWRRGTTTYHESRVVYKEQRSSEEAYEEGLVRMVEDFVVPARAMHTLDADNNKVCWYIRYQVEIPGWPDVDERFPLTVVPAYVQAKAEIPNVPLKPHVLRADPRLRFTFHLCPGLFDDRPIYTLGDDVEGAVEVDVSEPVNCRGVVVELVWETEGKGDKDTRQFWQERVHEGPLAIGRHRFPFRLKLPLGPASYDGALLMSKWEFRVWVDLAMRRDPGAGQPIWLVPPTLGSAS